MFKKIISSALAVCLAFGTAAVLPAKEGLFGSVITASAVTIEKCGAYAYTSIDDESVKIIEYTGNPTALSIPATLNGKKVTALGGDAFHFCSKLKTVEIPSGVTEVNGFFDCQNLTSVNIPYGVKTIGKFAFGECTSLRSIHLPESITSIEESAFQGCTNLISVNIPKKVTRIEKATFFWCENLRAISIPQGVTSIGEDAFCHCDKLKSIAMPASVKSIGKYAFYYDPTLMEVYYEGTNTQWKAIDIADRNDFLTCANIHYNITLPLLPSPGCFITSTSLYFTWSRIRDAEYYAVCGYVNNNWKILAKTSALEYKLTGLQPHTEYKLAIIPMVKGEWFMDLSRPCNVTTGGAPVDPYPVVQTAIRDGRIGFKWNKIPNAEKYGIGVYQANKWKVVKQLDGGTTTWTSPQVSGNTYRMVVLAKINGKWVNDDVFKRSFYVIVPGKVPSFG